MGAGQWCIMHSEGAMNMGVREIQKVVKIEKIS